MSMSEDLKLKALLEAFLHKGQRSKEHAAKIEGHLIEHYYEEVAFADLLEALARYQPGGGEFLYDEGSITPLIIESLREVEKRNQKEGQKKEVD